MQLHFDVLFFVSAVTVIRSFVTFEIDITQIDDRKCTNKY